MTRPRVLLTILTATCVSVGCQRVDDSQPSDAGDSSQATDAKPEVVLDVPYYDLTPDLSSDAATEIQSEVVPPATEACGNGVDDDGDGLVDEAGCYPGPNVRPGAAWLDLGTVTIKQGAAPSPLLPFLAEAKNQGMVAVGRYVGSPVAGQQGKYVWAEQLVSPAGVLAITPGAWATSPNRAIVGEGAATVLVGMSPTVSVIDGVWKIGFAHATHTPTAWDGNQMPAVLHVGVYSRPEIPAGVTASLDLDVFCIGGAPMPCAELAKSPQWKSILDKVKAVWAPAGIQLGAVELVDLGGDDGKKFKYIDQVGQGSQTNELFGVYQAAAKLRPQSTAVTLVLVSGLNDNGVSVAAGLSALAGVPGLPGQRSSGLAVAIEPTQWDQAVAQGPSSSYAGDVWGVVIAHEIGHFLGLWHTDEKTGSLHDPIADTPQCDLGSSQEKTAQTCPVQAKYLMFWAPTGVAVTAGQSKVVRLSPALR